MDTGRRFDLDACQAGCSGVLCESQLPSPLLDALREARAARPDRDVLCVAYRLEEDGREVARIGSACDGLDRVGRAEPGSQIRAKDVIVVSVVVIETTFERVRRVSHTLVARTQARRYIFAQQDHSPGSGSRPAQASILGCHERLGPATETV